MIVPFAIDPEALRLKPGDSWGPQRRLLALWRHLGALLPDAGPGGAKALAAAVEVLPQALRGQWQRAWRQQRCWQHGQPALCVVPQGQEGPKRVALAEVDLAEPFRLAALLAQQGVARQSSVETLWWERVSPLLQGARHVAVVDRYGVNGLAIARTPNAYRQQGHSGLAVFLNRGGLLTGSRSLRILAQDFPEAGLWTHLDQVVQAAMQGGAWAMVEVGLAPKNAFVRDGHDRHVRADHLAWLLGRGLDVLAGERVGLASDAVLVSSAEFARLREQSLWRAAQDAGSVRRWLPQGREKDHPGPFLMGW